MNSLLRFALPFFCTALTVFGEEFKVGVSRVDITPERPIRLAGYASRNKPSEATDQRLFVKALAIEDATGTVSLLLTADTIGTPRWFNDDLAGRIERELKISRERFLFACSHSHNTPIIRANLDDMYGLEGQDAAEIEAYARTFLEKSVQAAKEAIDVREPVRLSYGRSEAFFAANRRQFGPKGVGFGVNPNGLVDREVPVLKIDRADGSLKVAVFGYACHCTTPGATYEVSGDWAGYAQGNVEQAWPGATAMFITGCGADANPHPRGNIQLARGHGLHLAGAVARALNEPMRQVTGPIRAAFDHADLPIDRPPTREYYEAKLQDKAPAVQRYARRYVDRIDRSEPLMGTYPAPVQVWRFGDAFTLVALSGEVVVDYAFRLRRELPDQRLWVAGYTNDIFAYVPSMRILTEGGYEADFSIMYYGLPTRFAPAVEDTLVKKVHELIGKTAAAK
jgi:neutral ceramidase